MLIINDWVHLAWKFGVEWFYCNNELQMGDASVSLLPQTAENICEFWDEVSPQT